MGIVMRRGGAALVLGALLACGGARPVAPTPLEPEALGAAASRLEAFDAARDDVELVEGGLRAGWQTWRWEEREELPPPEVAMHPGGAPWMLFPERTRVRVLVGPFDRVVAWRRMEAVRVHRWLVGTALELDVEGEPEPLVLVVETADAAGLAEALDLVRRAHRPTDQREEAPPAD